MLKGIDVSFAQGRIDWDKLKGNIDFAILRCGFGNNQADQDDVQWARNVAECNRLGIPWGAYLYSYAESAADAGSEAAHVLRLIKGLKPAYPVYIDMEHDAAFKSRALSTAICKIFCDTVSPPGIPPGFTLIRIGRQTGSIWHNSPSTHFGWRSIAARLPTPASMICGSTAAAGPRRASLARWISITAIRILPRWESP